MFFDCLTIDFNGFSMVFEILMSMVNNGLENPSQQQVCKFNEHNEHNIYINDDWQFRLYKRKLHVKCTLNIEICDCVIASTVLGILFGKS